MTVPDRRPFTAAVKALLESGTGRPVGDHESPPGTPIVPDPGDAAFPYAVIYSVGMSTSGPALWAPDADADLVYQVTSVGLTRDQADWMADKVRRTVLARSSGSFQVPMVDPVGWVVSGRLSNTEPEGPVPIGAPPSRRWQVAERFTIQVTPGD